MHPHHIPSVRYSHRKSEMTVASPNRILNLLQEDQRARIMRAGKRIDLPKKRVLHEANVPITHVYFIERGLTSLVNPLSDGSALETGLCGAEGMVGIPLYLGGDRSISQAFQQVSGGAWELDREVFLEELDRGDELRAALGRVTLANIAMTSQTSVCHRRHSAEERCVRWLLHVDDHVQSPFDLTHDFLSQMVGVRRATVTVIAGGLQQAQLIRYHRGSITITNRPAMLDIVCECYSIIRNEQLRLFEGAVGASPLNRMQGSKDGWTTLGQGA
jgi:CRP-like cAMP-binding protein